MLVKRPPLSVRLRNTAASISNLVKNPRQLASLIWHGIVHTWHGFRLFFLEFRLSCKYIWKMRSEKLTRRERKQLIRTVADLFRLVPFSVFIIVPMMEVLLPFYIKLFPKMMPTTFQDTSRDEEKQLIQMKAKVETAKFLQDTLEEIALIRKNRAGIKEDTSKAYEFAQFLKRVREEGGYVTNAELFKFMKLFEDELTLDNLGMSQLRALCRLLGISKIGSPEILRFRLNYKLRELKADDKLIAAEGGVDVLSVHELQAACRARGMRAVGMSEDRLRAQLKQWLELSLDDQVPPSLLLLSRALFFPEEVNFTERLRSIVGALPNELAEHTMLKMKELEGITDPKARIELLKSIERALKQEKVEQSERQKEAKEAEKVVRETEATIEQIQEATAIPEEPTILSEEQAKAAMMAKRAKDVKGQEKLDPAMLESLEHLLHGGPEQEVKHDIEELKEKVTEHSEDLMEIGSLADDYKESKGSQRLRKRVHKLISKVDYLAAALENRRREIKETIADPAVPAEIESKKERLVHIKDLIESLGKLQEITGDRKRIEETLMALDMDVDGKVERELVLEVLDLLSKHKDVEINAAEMARMVEMLKKEDLIEELEANGIAQQPGAPELESEKDGEQVVPKLTAEDAEQFPIRPMTPESVGQPPSESSASEDGQISPPSAMPPQEPPPQRPKPSV